jgi:hypothetical protein
MFHVHVEEWSHKYWSVEYISCLMRTNYLRQYLMTHPQRRFRNRCCNYKTILTELMRIRAYFRKINTKAFR